MDQMNSQMVQLNEKFSQTPTLEPGHQTQEFVPTELNGPLFGQPTAPQVQAPTREFDDTDKLSLLCLEYTWSAEDDPLRPVIIKEMKKIKDGRDLIEELKKIEKNMNLNNIVSSQLELELSALVFDTCEVPKPAHTAETVGESPELERSQILEDKEALAMEDKELEILEDVHIVMQESDETGLPNPLDVMLASEFSALVSQYIIPLLNAKLKHDLDKSDNAYYAIDSAHDRIHVSHNPNAKIKLENACFDNSHIPHDDNCCPDYDTMLNVAFCSRHVPYCYTYIIGYSIDDIVGLCPVTFTLCFCENILRLSLVYHSLRTKMVRVDIPWDPGGFMAW